MHNKHYPNGTVQSLLQTDFVTANTKQVLQKRLDKEFVIVPLFFDADSFVTLRTVCTRLIPQLDADRTVDLAGELDRQLEEGPGNGWRYDAMPADKKAFEMGMKGVDETAGALFGRPFHLLPATQQDEVLTAIQSGKAIGDTWNEFPSKLFFEELLAALVEIYYSHPFAKDKIGEAAFADAKGWEPIGLNKSEPHEPQPLEAGIHPGN